jgi:hypothetical protein
MAYSFEAVEGCGGPATLRVSRAAVLIHVAGVDP